MEYHYFRLFAFDLLVLILYDGFLTFVLILCFGAGLSLVLWVGRRSRLLAFCPIFLETV